MITIEEIKNRTQYQNKYYWRILRWLSKEHPFDGYTTSTIELAAGYTITKVNDDRYSFSVSGETATTGSIQGGGSVATAGPVTVDA